MKSFQNGIKKGTNVLELDVCITKDLKVVVCHDNKLDRMCGINRKTEEFNYEDLPPFQEEIRLDFSVGMKYNKE